nr:hypothetical protein [Tanacetum cinerariifolium]
PAVFTLSDKLPARAAGAGRPVQRLLLLVGHHAAVHHGVLHFRGVLGALRLHAGLPQLPIPGRRRGAALPHGEEVVWYS